MNALPQAIAGANFHIGIIAGKLNGVMPATTPKRLPQRIDVDAGAGAFGVFALHQVRNADGEFHHLEPALDVALGVRNGLAVLARQKLGELVVVALGQFEELHHHAGAALRIGRRPFHLRDLGILDRCAHFGFGRQRHLGLDVAGHRFENVRRTSRGALDLTAADKMSDCAHVFLQS